MNFDSKSVAAIVLCLAFYLAYSHYLSTKYPNKDAQTAGEQQTPAGVTPPGTTPASAIPPALGTPAAALAEAQAALPKLAAEDLVVETDTNIYKFDAEIGGLTAVSLKGYQTEKVVGAPPINLLQEPLVLQGTIDPKQTAPVRGVFGAERTGRTVRFTRLTPTFKIAQEYTIPDKGYAAKLKVMFTNVTGGPLELPAGGLLTRQKITFRKAQSFGFIPGTVVERDQLVRYDGANNLQLNDLQTYCAEPEAIRGQNLALDFIGFDKHYFLDVLLPKAKKLSLDVSVVEYSEAHCALAFTLFDSFGMVAANETVALDFDTYFGPKDLEILKAIDPKLEESLDLGMFAFIARPLLAVIEGFKKLTGNYGIAIILLTIALKILFYPLMRASAVSMHKMKKLNPEMTAIREKFKDDKAKQQQELMKFMGANKINPMKGCLPILPQIPVFFAYYTVLQTSIHLRHAPFFGWIDDLAAMDPYFITPLLMGVAMFVQQKLTPTTGMDKTQEKILLFMPIMFTFMMLTLPAGLTLYMLTNTVVGILQQRWLYHKLDKLNA